MSLSLRASNIWTSFIVACPIIGTYCLLCARKGQKNIDLCQACESLLMTNRYISDSSGVLQTACCLGCGDEMPDDQEFCVVCRDDHSDLLFTRIVAAYRYAFPLDKLIKQVKYRHDRRPGRLLGTLLARSIAAYAVHPMPQVLVPMPLYANRQIDRGFNQSLDLARWCGHCLGIEVRADLAWRLVDTGSLAGLSRAERQLRILGAFRGSDPLVDRHVAIIDDVLTTGSSARELAREIYDCGAASVELWTLARTSRRRGASGVI